MEFLKVNRERMEEIAPYFAAQTTHISDFSLGFQFMWNRSLAPEYAFAGGCLVLRELYAGKHYFHYPLSRSGDPAAEERALDEIERFCRDKNERLHYRNVPREKLMLLIRRYGTECALNDRRRWRDYLYLTENFQTYAGKRYAGQRNHVNRFLKKHPDWRFRAYEKEDEARLLSFLDEYETGQLAKGLYLAREEMEETRAIVPKLSRLGMRCGLLTAGGKVIGFSAGERCGDMLVVHIEKALKEYEGAYPFLAQQFARAFGGDVKYLNRMDDAGDGGLRKSKLQYLPEELVSKYSVFPKRPIDLLSHLPEIATERLTLKGVEDADEPVYARLARDVARNRYWGYDWREDCTDETPPDGYFLTLAREDFRRKDEMPLGIYLEGALIGEAVLHRFGYRGEAELGVRLLPEAEGKGYAREAVSALAEYAFLKLGLERAEAKCYRENERSRRMLLSAGFRPSGGDETFFYFVKTADM